MNRDAIVDRTERRIAATEFGANLVVVAGAGTGKTSLLVERVLNAVGSARVGIDEIAAMTFTEKAAGEMRERLAEQLERLSSFARGHGVPDDGEAARSFDHLAVALSLPRETIAERATVALERLERATVTTIHGFAADLLRGHPVAAGVDPDFVVDTGEKAERLRREVWERYLADELGREAPRRDLWKRLLARVTLADVERAAFAMADYDLPTSMLHPPFELPTARALLGEEVRPIVDGLDALLARESGLAASARSYFTRARDHLSDFLVAEHRDWIARIDADAPFANRIRDGEPPSSFRRLTGFPREEAGRLARESRGFLRSLLAIDDDAAVWLLELLAPFVIAFREAMLRQSLLTFDGLLVLARDLLRRVPAVRQQVKQRYRMLLVDEFQDTDPVQYEIVLLLGERAGGAADDAFAVELEPGKLFVVGDEKQSIYRFRGADYTAYERATDRVIAGGGRRLELSANFRSVAGVVEPVNRLFGAGPDSRWRTSPYQPCYRAIHAVRPDESGAATELWTLRLDGAPPAETRRRAEGELIAEQIDRAVREGAARPREITILLRAFTSLAPYLRPLRHRRIPFVVDGGRDFLERPEATQLIAAIRSLARPSDPVALLAFLRSPAGSVSDEELSRYADHGGRWSFDERPDAARFPLISRRLRLLREMERETAELPADAAIRHVIERTGMLPLNAAAFEGPQRVANLAKLAAVAGEMARDGQLSLAEVADSLESGRLAELESEAPLADDAIDAVRVSTIHRMKGLENRWVILPDLARFAPGSSQSVTAAAVRSPVGQTLALTVGGKSSSGAVWLRREDRRHEIAEELRLLYVALTRARDRLVVVAGPTSREAPWLDALRPWGFDPDAPPEDGARLCDGRVLHRVLRPVAEERPLEPHLHGSAEPACARYRLAVERLAAARGPTTPSGLVDEPAAER
ncbi:MAG TPA: UvrD-helicase domain-containing protein, partial [Candidatus Polarisedimenticolaceae bacterium]|nr:UvrD-helicase domain-containing protein [Candidatus Polarisedimenticolaceae bacterium]